MKELYVNVQVRKFLGGIIPEEHTQAKFLNTLNRSLTTDSKFWVVRIKENNQFIGLVSINKHVNGEKELSYEFLPFCWGQGYAAEVISRIIKFAFEELGIDKLLAETQIANVISCKLLTKVGMKLEQEVHRFGAQQGIFSIEK